MSTKDKFENSGKGISRRNILQATSWAVGACGVLPIARASGQQVGGEGPIVWLGMNQEELDAAYDQSAYASNREQIVEQEMLSNQASIARLGQSERFAYGAGATESLEVYSSGRENAPIHIHFHGGTWRFGAARNFAYMAEPFVRKGAVMVIPDFSSVVEEDGGLPVLARQVREAVAWTYRNAERFGGNPERIYVSGHSSGGHLVAVVLTTDWPGTFNLPENLIKGGLCISGMFDLEPVQLSWRDSYLHLTDDVVEALSPQRHIDHLNAPVIIANGTLETPEFQRQAKDFAAAIEVRGKPVQRLIGAGYNHFEIRVTLGNPYGLLGYAALEQMGLGV